ncbi:MAG: hypothetical protein ABIR18_16305 [Chitinophagaceae bacterium]
MNPAIAPVREVVESIHYRPSVSIIMPFEPQMHAKAELTQRLTSIANKVEEQIKTNYSDEIAVLVVEKLRTAIKNLNFNNFKKSIAIYISPVFEKVLYLDIPLQEKVIVNGSFKARDLLSAKEVLRRYLVLVVTGTSSKVYLGNSSSLIKVKANVPDHISAFENDPPERVGNFSDPAHRKEVLLKKFLHATDDGLKLLLHAYPLPVFVIGSKKVIGYFNALTKNEKNIAGYIHGSYEDATETQINELLIPYLNDWPRVKTNDLFRQIENAKDAEKLASGIRNVWKQAVQHKGRLLILEKSFTGPSQQITSEPVIYMPKVRYTRYSNIKDAVDEIIERVLESGGDVEFVDDGSLNDHQHICLI